MNDQQLGDIIDDLTHFQHRIIQDALAEATRTYWLRRADDFQAVGTPTCDLIAQACRYRAVLAPIHDNDFPSLDDLETGAA